MLGFMYYGFHSSHHKGYEYGNFYNLKEIGF
jgi:hypothetical protein